MSESLTFGVDWYPEQWEEIRWGRDAERMKAFGISYARMMEFAWAIVEPERGRFDFSLFDRALDALWKRGIRALLGTPTATFPAWLLDSGDVLQTAQDRRVRDFGARRMACFNSPVYRSAARELVGACAEHFGKDQRVIGWQVDNEIGHEGSDRCVCANCASAWHAWLERRFGDVAAMNKEWGSVFWGTSYSRFDQVPLPRRQVATGFNPGLLLDFDRFSSESAAAFVDEQVAILRAAVRPDCFVTTNLYPPPLSNAIDMERLTRGMDFASYDNYPVWGPQDEPYPYLLQSFAHSYVRGLHGASPFAVMEEFSGIQGHACLGHLPPERQVALWTNQAIARGANRILYFRWRTAPFGQEQLCHGLYDNDDRETERARVLRANAREVRTAFSLFAAVPFESEACLVYSKDDARVLREQYLSEGLRLSPTDWVQAGYDLEAASWFAPYVVFNVNADVKSVGSVDLDKYRVVSIPLYQMADPEFVARVDTWVKKGGRLIIGYRAGTRDMRNWNVGVPLPGLFEEMAGIQVQRFESLNKTTVGIRIGAAPARGEKWADLIETRDAKPVAFYSDRRKFYSGLPCATVNDHGRGKVWYIGTGLDPRGVFFLYRTILKEAKMNPRFLGYGIEVVERRTVDENTVKVVLNHTPRSKRVLGRRLPPWGWAVVE
jgi:beta-galactosidase